MLFSCLCTVPWSSFHREDVEGHNHILTACLLRRIAPHVAFTLIFVSNLQKFESKMGL